MTQTDPTTRIRRITVAAAAGGGLALGITGLAYAAPSTPPAAPPASAPAAPSDPAAPSASAGTESQRPQHTHQPHLDGTVTSLSDGHIMIEDRSGFTRQINIATVPDGVTTGVRIHAEGTVNADGVSLDATTVTVAPARPENGTRPDGPAGRPEGGPGKGGRGPHGGPGRSEPAPAPSSSAAPAPSDSAAPAPSSSTAPAPTTTS